MGLGIIIINNKLAESFSEKICGSYSLNLKRHYNLAIKSETCNSVSISAMNALNTALFSKYRTKEKILSTYKKYYDLFNYTYEKLGNLDYKFLISKEKSCPAVITVIIDNSNYLIDYLKYNNFIVYPCKGSLFNKGFQISFYGYDADFDNIDILINLLSKFNKTDN